MRLIRHEKPQITLSIERPYSDNPVSNLRICDHRVEWRGVSISGFRGRCLRVHVTLATPDTGTVTYCSRVTGRNINLNTPPHFSTNGQMVGIPRPSLDSYKNFFLPFTEAKKMLSLSPSPDNCDPFPSPGIQYLASDLSNCALTLFLPPFTYRMRWVQIGVILRENL